MGKPKLSEEVSISFSNYEKIELSDLEDFVRLARERGMPKGHAECRAGYVGNQMDHEEPSATLTFTN